WTQFRRLFYITRLAFRSPLKRNTSPAPCASCDLIPSARMADLFILRGILVPPDSSSTALQAMSAGRPGLHGAVNELLKVSAYGPVQSQALSHYKGTKHAKKLKSLDTPKSKAKSSVVAKETTSKWPGSAARDTTTAKEPPKSLRPTAPPQPGTDREEDSPHVLLHPTSPPLAPQILVEAESTSAAAASEQGSGLAPGAPQPAEQDTETDPEAETEEEKALRLLYCSLCKVAVNSPSQLEAHNSGTKHKTMLEARNGNGSIKSFPRPGVKSKLTTSTAAATGLQNKTFHCETCDVHVNSETQLKQHISSRRHKDRAAGKPAKPKYSPYAKTQRGQTKQQTQLKVPLSKDLCQPLQATLVPSHLAAVATAAAVGPTFPLRASHSPSLFQTQPLPTALLRAAPGPIRTTHAPVLFAPY
ncbi:hypothetical protein P4O66_004888, partial [Electrophorus voltai]